MPDPAQPAIADRRGDRCPRFLQTVPPKASRCPSCGQPIHSTRSQQFQRAGQTRPANQARKETPARRALKAISRKAAKTQRTNAKKTKQGFLCDFAPLRENVLF